MILISWTNDIHYPVNLALRYIQSFSLEHNEQRINVQTIYFITSITSNVLQITTKITLVQG